MWVGSEDAAEFFNVSVNRNNLLTFFNAGMIIVRFL